jgi:hypothetical protein
VHPKAVIAALAASVLVVACAPRDAEIRRARMAAERRSLEATLDALEERLLVDQARVRFWREMRERHESVTAIACTSLEEHAAEMARLRVRPGDGRELAARRGSVERARVASVSLAPAEPATAAPVPASMPASRSDGPAPARAPSAPSALAP